VVADHTQAVDTHHSHLDYNPALVGYNQKLVPDCNYNQCCLLELQKHQGFVAEMKVADYSNHKLDFADLPRQLTGPS
jgi:hypothetical protein